MPTAFATACTEPGCPEVTHGGRCPAHRRAYERQRGTATQRGYGQQWRERRALILERDPICRDESGCGEPSMDVDHITPRRQGGTDNPANLRGMCHRHHSSKTMKETQCNWG